MNAKWRSLEAELWGHTKFYNKNEQIIQSIRRKMKRWSPKLERQHHFFENENLKKLQVFNDFACPGIVHGRLTFTSP